MGQFFTRWTRAWIDRDEFLVSESQVIWNLGQKRREFKARTSFSSSRLLHFDCRDILGKEKAAKRGQSAPENEKTSAHLCSNSRGASQKDFQAGKLFLVRNFWFSRLSATHFPLASDAIECEALFGLTKHSKVLMGCALSSSSRPNTNSWHIFKIKIKFFQAAQFWGTCHV